MAMLSPCLCPWLCVCLCVSVCVVDLYLCIRWRMNDICLPSQLPDKTEEVFSEKPSLISRHVLPTCIGNLNEPKTDVKQANTDLLKQSVRCPIHGWCGSGVGGVRSDDSVLPPDAGSTESMERTFLSRCQSCQMPREEKSTAFCAHSISPCFGLVYFPCVCMCVYFSYSTSVREKEWGGGGF